MKGVIQLMLKGAAMGMAEVVPGVSGGTIAFITGIYEELIDTIKGLTPAKFKILFQEGPTVFWTSINGNFIINLLTGMLMGIVCGVFLITYLVENFPEILWGFFFGLILASSVYIYRIMPQRRVTEFITIVVGFLIAFLITSFAPSEGSTSYPFVFLSGMIAISALLLPGISGSFILLLMGMYVIIIPEVKHLLQDFNVDSLLLVLVFLAGCFVGMVSFSRLVSYAFKKFKSLTFALLAGFMLGSLNKIWPWQEAVRWISEDGTIYKDLQMYKGEVEDVKVLQEVNVLPVNYDGEPYLLFTLIAFVIGILIVYFLTRNENPIASDDLPPS